MKEQKLIFFDIDGTLLNHDKQLPKRTKEAIHQLKEEGHIVAIATGRGPFMYEQLREALAIDTYVSYNGSYVVHDNEIIYRSPLDKSELERLTTEALEKGHPLMYMDETRMKQNTKHHHYITESIESLKLGIDPGYDPDYYKDRDLYQTLFFIDDKEEDYFREQYPAFDFVRWHPLSVDVLPAGGSKAFGIIQLVDYLGYDKADVYVFGDGPNDIEMLSMFGHSVAMGNGCEEAKQVAGYVTKDVDEDGLYYGLKQVGLL